jgi:hypothetical protein
MQCRSTRARTTCHREYYEYQAHNIYYFDSTETSLTCHLDTIVIDRMRIDYVNSYICLYILIDYQKGYSTLSESH